VGEQTEPKNQDVFLCSLKTLWLSNIPVSERRERFPDALEQIPPRLVTTSIFCNVFFPKLTATIRGNLDGERAWFGIRSILKGGTLAVSHDDNYNKKDLAQLGVEKDKIQIPAKHTKKYFADSELQNLLEISTEYKKWLQKHGYYDDIDLVLRAAKHLDGAKARDQEVKNKRFEEMLVNQKNSQRKAMKSIQFNDKRVLFKKPAQKELKKLQKNEGDREVLHKWLARNILEKNPFNKFEVAKIPNRLVDYTEAGVPIHKSNITSGGRIYWTPLNRNGKDCTIVIYDFCMSKEKGDPRLKKILNNYKFSNEDEDEDEDETDQAVPVDFSIDQTPCEGPTKPWPNADKITLEVLGQILDDSNIQLDELQELAILSNQPLLIDGLAGTGKTSVLSYRGVVRCASSPPGTTVLVTASKDHVVQKISEAMHEIKERGTYGKEHFEMNYKLGPGIFSEQHPSMDIEKFYQSIPEIGFDEIILDECQDITAIEFEMLKRLLIGHNSRRLVFAGDPLQTLNPTGFNWNRIKAMFIENGVSISDVKIQKFYNNYRSQAKIVEFANAIQQKRSKTLGDKDETAMNPMRGGTDYIRLIKYDLSIDNHMNAISEVIENSGESKAIIITPSPDDAGIQSLLSGEETPSQLRDPVMAFVWEKKQQQAREQNKTLSISEFREVLYLHSASSVKGDEYPVVILYRFASNKSARNALSSLLEKWDEITAIQKEDEIKIRFEFSKLYVALTRALQRIYLIEDQEGFTFWKDLKLYSSDEKAIPVNTYIDFEGYIDPISAMSDGDLQPESEASMANYESERNKFRKDPSNIIALQLAIGLGKRILHKFPKSQKELWDLQGEWAWHQSRMPGRSPKEKSNLEKAALDFFTKAGKYDKAGPIYYGGKNYTKCLETIQDTDDEFYEFIRMICKISLKQDITKDLKSSLRLLNTKIQPNTTWARINPMDAGREIIRNWILKNFTAKILVNTDDIENTFKLNEIYDHYHDNNDRIYILENWKLNKNNDPLATKTTKWGPIYLQMVIDYISNIKSAPSQAQEFYAKTTKVIKPSHKDWKALQELIDSNLFYQLNDKPKKVSMDLKQLFHELGKLKNPFKNPLEIKDDQIRGLFLAKRLHGTVNEVGDMGVWKTIFKAIEEQLELQPTLFQHFQIVEELYKLPRSLTTSNFPKSKNLTWLNPKNFKLTIDLYAKKLFEDSIKEPFNDKHPDEIWKDYIFIPQKKSQNKKGIYPGAKAKRTEFTRWFEAFYKYILTSNAKKSIEPILKKLFEWTNSQYFDAREFVFNTITYPLNRTTPFSLLFECEQTFIKEYIINPAKPLTNSDFDMVIDLKDADLTNLTNKIRWEKDEFKFINQLENPTSAKSIDQKKLSRYIAILRKNGFVEEAEKAEEKQIVSAIQAEKLLTKEWKNGTPQSYFELRKNFFGKGIDLPQLPEMDEGTLDRSTKWFLQYGLGFCGEQGDSPFVGPGKKLSSKEAIHYELERYLFADSLKDWLDQIGLFNPYYGVFDTGAENYDIQSYFLEPFFPKLAFTSRTNYREIKNEIDTLESSGKYWFNAVFLETFTNVGVLEIEDTGLDEIVGKMVKLCKKDGFFVESSMEEVFILIKRYKGKVKL